MDEIPSRGKEQGTVDSCSHPSSCSLSPGQRLNREGKATLTGIYLVCTDLCWLLSAETLSERTLAKHFRLGRLNGDFVHEIHL